jgi:hypothetical protein
MVMTQRLRLTGVLGAALLAAPPAASQVSRPLSPANASLSEEFVSIRSVRELADGRVLISDASPAVTRLVVADLARGRVRQIGRTGSGPWEYGIAGKLLALAADSTLLVDESRGLRWLLLRGDSIVLTVPPDDPGLRAAGVALIGADNAGNVLKFREINGPNSATMTRAIRVNRRTGASDTAIALRGAEWQTTQTTRNGRPFYIVNQLNLSVSEQAVLFADGHIAIARLSPFRVEWVSPAGVVMRGPALPWSDPRLDEAEKLAYYKRVKRSPPPDPEPFAATVPPFDGALMALPDGSVLLRRTPWSGDLRRRYAVIDRRGIITREIVVPDNQRIIGFGPKSAYLITTDDDGIQRLSRHAWP